MPKLKVMPEEKIFEFASGKNLMRIMLDEGLYVENACGGKGLCGKCKIKIIEGSVNEAGETEKGLLKADELEQGVRLACLAYPCSDISVELLRKEKKHDVLASGFMPDFGLEPDIRKTAGEYTADPIYGVAIDIGTTTVVCSLVDMETGEELGHSSEINAQKSFGLDVITRITYETENPSDGRQKLQKAIVGSINRMVRSLCERHGISQDQIYEFAVGANCTMMHMLLGVDASSIGRAPFEPVFTSAKDIEASSIGLEAAACARLYCLPSVSAYIGADIVAGAYVCDLKHRRGNTLFIDIGTNGEIVLASDGKLISCSCAAGPALEGMNISSGMRASEGAIEDIHINKDGIELKVIGNSEPVGICGSGILAVTKELLRTGIVRNTGAFVKTGKFSADDYRSQYINADEQGRRSFRMTDGDCPLYITQGDIRQVQLAKGAILSGVTALTGLAGIGMEAIDKVLIAGQFGAHLPPESITGTGILPFEVEDRIEYVGNTSKTGAYMALMSSKARRGMEELAREIDYLDLCAMDKYENLLSECLIFPAYDKVTLKWHMTR